MRSTSWDVRGDLDRLGKVVKAFNNKFANAVMYVQRAKLALDDAQVRREVQSSAKVLLERTERQIADFENAVTDIAGLMLEAPYKASMSLMNNAIDRVYTVYPTIMKQWSAYRGAKSDEARGRCKSSLAEFLKAEVLRVYKMRRDFICWQGSQHQEVDAAVSMGQSAAKRYLLFHNWG